MLVTGHAGDGIIQNNHRRVGIVIGNVDKPGNTGMHEGRVADNRDGAVVAGAFVGFVKAMQARHGSTHTNGGVNGGQRRHRAQGVTADVSVHGEFVLFQGVEQAAVGTPRAHDRRAHGDGFVEGCAAGFFHAKFLGYEVLAEFAHAAEQFFALDLQTDVAAMGFDDAVELLDNNHPLHVRGKGFDFFDRQGVYQAEFEHRICIATHLFDVLVTGGGGDDADGVVAARLHPVEGGGFRIGG